MINIKNKIIIQKIRKKYRKFDISYYSTLKILEINLYFISIIFLFGEAGLYE